MLGTRAVGGVPLKSLWNDVCMFCSGSTYRNNVCMSSSVLGLPRNDVCMFSSGYTYTGLFFQLSICLPQLCDYPYYYLNKLY